MMAFDTDWVYDAGEGFTRFVLYREQDETGISGTGIVAWGVEFPDRTCVMRWCSEHTSTAVYASIEDIRTIHGHSGKTLIVQLDPETYVYEG